MSNFKRASVDAYAYGTPLDPLDEDPVYEAQPNQVLRVVNGGLEPKRMRRGSYVEDDSYSNPSSPALEGPVSRPRENRDYLAPPDNRRSSRGPGRTTRRPQIQGPQPQPLQPAMLQPSLYASAPQAASKSQYSNSSASSTNRVQQSQGLPRNPRPAKDQLPSPSFGRYSPPLEADEDDAIAQSEQIQDTQVIIGFELPRSNSDKSTESAGPTISSNGSSIPSPGILTPPHELPGHTQRTSGSNLTAPSFPFPPPSVQASARRISSSSTSSGGLVKQRGPTSSYFSHNSYLVSPIPEESTQYRHGSFASSHVIPSSWGSGIPGLWIPSTNEELMSDGASSISKTSGMSRRTDGEDYDEGSNLVRQASLGRLSKPKLTNVSAPSEKDTKSRSSKSDSRPASSGRRTSIVSLKLESLAKKSLSNDSKKSSSSPTELADDGMLPPPKPTFWQRLSRNSIRTVTPDPPIRPLRITNSHERKPSANGSQEGYYPQLAVPTSALSRPRQPPRLDMNAIHEAERRGSLTSLPDLIRRATKLAAVLETGSRPDSRWGHGSRAPSIMSTDTGSGIHPGRYQESLSDILASFPPPMASTRRLSTRDASWPLPQDLQYLQSRPYDINGMQMKEKRKICGLPLWAFVVLILLAIIVVTAAVILPVQLIALSKDKNKAATGPTVDSCGVSMPCLNGGISSVDGGKCSCICTGTFGGATCAVNQDPACTIITLSDSTSTGRNVSIGIAIPRLIAAASKYQVAVNAAGLVASFQSSNSSCAFENALVNLDGRVSPPGVNPTATATANTASATGTSSNNNTGSTSSSSSSGSSTSYALDENVVDFSRVAVLFLAETVGMNSAEAAQEVLQEVFTAGRDYGVVSGPGFKVDLTNLKITIGNGTSSGDADAATSGSLNTSSSSTRFKLVRSLAGKGNILRRHRHRHRTEPPA